MPTHSRAQRATDTKSRNTVPNLSSPSVPATPFVRAATQSGGSALDKKTQNEMSAKFGHDFSQVRIHTDSRAEDSAEAMGANAYAHGTDIVFGAGRYQPGSLDTERLLAHELTHVVQQSLWGPGDAGRVSGWGDASEREADAASRDVMNGRGVEVQAAPRAAIARDDADRDYALNAGATLGSFLPGPLGMLAGAFGGEEALRTMPADGPLRTMKQAEGLAGFGNSVLGTAAYFGGFDATAALGSEASLSTLGGAGLEGAAALGPAALLAGAGLFGLGTGHYLYENTEVGEDSQDALGGIDGMMGGTPGHSKLVAMDDRRQELWDKGGVWNDTKSIGYGLGEAGIATAGAVGGLAEGAYHGIGHGASWLWNHTLGDSGPSNEQMAADQKQADAVMSQTMDDRMNAEEQQELYGPSTSVAHEEMPPLPAKGQR